MKFLGIGFGSYVAVEKIVGVFAPDSAPIRRMISDARERGFLIDASFGRSTRSVLLMNSNHVILSSQPSEDLYTGIQSGDSAENGKGGNTPWRNGEN